MEGGYLHFEGGALRTELSLLRLLVGAKKEKVIKLSITLGLRKKNSLHFWMIQTMFKSK